MKSKKFRVSAAALALAICVSISPIATAAPADREMDVRERIVRVIKKVQRLLGIGTCEETPLPPRP